MRMLRCRGEEEGLGPGCHHHRSFHSFINAFHCLVVCLPACATWPKRSGVIIKGERRTYCRYLLVDRARQDRTGQDRTNSSSAFCIFVLAYALLALPALCWSSKIRLLPSMGIIVSVHVKRKKTWRPFHAACRQSPSFCTQRWSDLLTVSVFLGFFYCWHAMSGHVYVLA